MTQDQTNQLIELLNAVKDHMTVQDVEDEFGHDANMVRRVCSKFNITLLSHSERNLLYIRQVSEVLTIDRIAKRLRMRIDYVKQIADAAGIKLLEAEKPLFLRGRRVTRDMKVA